MNWAFWHFCLSNPCTALVVYSWRELRGSPSTFVFLGSRGLRGTQTARSWGLPVKQESDTLNTSMSRNPSPGNNSREDARCSSTAGSIDTTKYKSDLLTSLLYASEHDLTCAVCVEATTKCPLSSPRFVSSHRRTLSYHPNRSRGLMFPASRGIRRKRGPAKRTKDLGGGGGSFFVSCSTSVLILCTCLFVLAPLAFHPR